MVNMERLGNLIRSGCTLVLDALNQFDPTMEIACRALQWWSHEAVQVNAYLTTQETVGFALHWDDHDVIVVQLAGDKDWEIRSPSRAAPMYRDTAPNLKPSDQIIWSGTLQTGDVLYIPRGHWHQATRSGRGKGFSLHVTFGLVKRTGVDWLAWLADHSRQEELFRQDLDRWGAGEGHQDQARALAEAASHLLASFSPSNFLIAREQEHLPSRHLATWGIFGPVSIVVCVTEFKPVFDTDSDVIVIRAAGKKITFRMESLPALRILLSGLPADLNYVSSTTGIDAARLANVLLQEGICAEVTPELSSGYTGLAMHENFLKQL
nr:cupin domain-containing protein [Frankia sp. Cr1]